MKQHLAIAVCLSLAAPAVAQETEEGFDLVEEGAQLILRGLMNELQPTLDELEEATRELGPAMIELLDEMGPALAVLAEEIDSLIYYEAPEILPNGDIIIRRKDDAPPFEPGEIEL